MKKVWQGLMKSWAKTAKGPVDKVCYQTPRRIENRLNHFIKHCIPVLKDRKVLEFGCNAGFFGYNIDKVSKSYIGVEPGILISRKKGKGVDYYKQAQITQKEMSANAKFLNMTVQQFCSVATHDYDALVLCFVLYHLETKEVKLLIDKVLPKCKVVVIQNRNQKRPTKHNSYKFWKTNNVKKFFEHYGFKCQVIKAGKYDEIICKKPEKKLVIPKEHTANKIVDDLIMSKETETKGNALIKKAIAKKTAIKKAPLKKSVKKVIKRAVRKPSEYSTKVTK